MTQRPERRVGRAAGDELARLPETMLSRRAASTFPSSGAPPPRAARAPRPELRPASRRPSRTRPAGLVRDRAPAQLDGDGHAQIRRCGNGGIGVGAQSLVRDRDAGRREPALWIRNPRASRSSDTAVCVLSGPRPQPARATRARKRERARKPACRGVPMGTSVHEQPVGLERSGARRGERLPGHRDRDRHVTFGETREGSPARHEAHGPDAVPVPG